MILFCAHRDLMLPAWEVFNSSLGESDSLATLVRTPEELESMVWWSKPEIVFLPDWSWIVPESLLRRSRFVGFHSAALPEYRGGSPLQHQILDGLTSTKLSCFEMSSELDGGDILCQADLSLEGTIAEVWERIAGLVPGMCLKVLRGDVKPRKQAPGGFACKRRKPSESQMPDGLTVSQMYDWMRALDDPYPNAFKLVDGRRYAFSKPSLVDGRLTARVEITDVP